VIPQEKYKIDKPFFLGATLKDYVCIAPVQIMSTKKWCSSLTVKQYDADHWAMWSHADEINRDLLAWLETLPKA
jgi:soluble epoxide hydrolase/lipid-phosphate phosphatase